MTIKVAHLVYSFGIGGLEQVIVNLINHSLKSQDDFEHIIITLVNTTDSHDRLESKIPIFTLNKKEGNDLGSHFRLIKLLKNIKPDVMQTYNFGTIEYQFSAALAGVKKQIHAEHGYGGDDSRGTSQFRNFIRRSASFFLDYYVVVSPDLYEWAKNVLKIKLDKLKLVFNGIDTNHFAPLKNKFDKFTICSIGRADPVKNQTLLIESYCKACSENEDFKQESQLLIVGDGPIFKDLNALVSEKKVEENVKLLGYREDTAEILQQSHIFVLSSNYEAMPMTILEAMSCGLPVISTKVGGVEYLVTEREGWLVSAGNVEELSKNILRVYVDKSLITDKVTHCREVVQNKYGLDLMSNQYSFMYK